MRRYRSRLAAARAKRRRALMIGALALALVWAAGFIHYVMTVGNATPTAETTHTDAVVALTGGALRVTTGLAVLSAVGPTLAGLGVHEDFQKRFPRHGPRRRGRRRS